MSLVKEGKCYNYGTDYDTEFDHIAYLEASWGDDAWKTFPWSRSVVNGLHDIIQKLKLPENAAQLNVGQLVDVRMAISSSRVCSDITLAEFSSKSRRMLTSWLKGEDVGFSWTNIFEYVGQKEGRTAKEVEKRTRASIREILACDLLQKDIFGVARLPQFDLVSTQFGPEIACKDITQYNEAVKKLSLFTKPGGYLVLVAIFHETFYKIKGKIFHALTLTRKDVEEALASAGFEPAEWYNHEVEGECVVEYDGTGCATLVARKKE